MRQLTPIGISAIKIREGIKYHIYKDSKGLPTGGIGHLLSPEERVKFPVGTKVSREQVDRWFDEDITEVVDAVNSIGVELTPNQFDALVSLGFNIGVKRLLKSTAVRCIKKGDMHDAAEAFLLWDKPPEIQGRRHAEYLQFKTPYHDDFPAAVPTEAATHVPATETQPADTALNTADNPSVQPPQGDSPGDTNPPTELKVTETTDHTKTELTTIAGHAADVPPVQVSRNGAISKWIASGGGLGAIGTAVWGFITGHLDAAAIGIICVTFLITVLIFRGAILDAIRMQAASDPNRFNVK